MTVPGVTEPATATTPPPSSGQRLTPTSLTGLSSEEVRRRLAKYGPNEPASEQRTSVLKQIALLFANPLIVILLIAATITAALGELADALIIFVIVAFSLILDFFQTYRSQRAAEHLRATVAPTATAMRDGKWVEVPRREIVPGDVVHLSAGDLVPGDGVLLEARDLHLNEAPLTGESLPVEKAPASGADTTANPAEINRVYLGTSVVSGSGIAQITTTGAATMFGDIATRLATRAPETEFDRGIRQYSLLITRVILLLVLFVFLVTSALHHNPLQALTFAVALAVGLTPEFLPMIITITLSQGALRMAQHKTIVKNLSAIQNFGSMDTFCSDKTGTLTTGEMTLEGHVGAMGEPDAHVFLLAYLNSYYETGIDNEEAQAVLRHGGAGPLDLAILRHDHPSVEAYRKFDEIPFDFDRRRQSVVVETATDHILITKGAPEGVVALCTSYQDGDKTREFDAASREQTRIIYEKLNADGYRVIAVAYRSTAPQSAYTAADERDLTLAGYVSFADPPLPDTAATITALRDEGVSVKIITGDNELVARHVAVEAGLEPGQILLGDEIQRMTDPALAAVAEKTTIFARVSPAQKNRIILALKARGHVVGYMGDGINDAPSLHAADVGISVTSATDVARDAADIILLQPGLDVLQEGILEGRRAFGNVMKYLLMGTSSNFGNMFSMAAASLFLPFLPMLPIQILLNNFLYDLAQVTIPTDNVDPSFIQKPRRWDMGLIRDFMLYIGPISSLYDFLTFYVLLNVFHASEAAFHTGWFVESLATQTLVVFIIRTVGNPFQSRPSLPLTLTVVAVVLFGMILPFTSLGSVLGFTPLPAAYYVFLALATVTYLFIVEIVKRRLFGRRGF
ncbi:MAG: magnesium-translocating P-type ATPase [Anaerolineae bacterium]